VLIVALRRAFPRLPALVVAVAAVSAAVALAGVPVETIAGRFGELPRALPWPQIPPITPDRLIALLPLARIIAFLAAVESLLSAIVADRMIGGQHRPNAKVNAPGWGNPGSALFGGMPATGAIARTAGARTLMSTPLPVSTTVSSRAEGDLDGEPPAGINPRTQSGGIGQGKGNARH
jgi:SulP family sulfate permease